MNFGGLMESKRGDPYKMYNIKFVQPGSNFAQFSRIKKQASNQNLKSQTKKQKIGATLLFPGGLERFFSLTIEP